ncbi:DUF7344 domain-containing protein [Halopelagius fulvigenes]|uniref:DUF7344 domain-containing protein n=1 Tax=Halopelagius fulvigenes TaxID=1198324 RepID=A0ABD5TWB6_9EURY
MNRKRGTRSADSGNPTLRCIADGRRRAALRILLDAGERLAVRELASRLADAKSGAPDAAENAAETELVHAHLPMLTDAGLVEWDRDGRRVEAAAHPALEDPRFRRLLETETEGTDEALSALADERRRLALTALRDDGAAASRFALAGEVLRRETGDSDPDTDDIRRVELQLHHAHLPKLDDANFVAYDAETGRAEYADHPALEAVFTTIHEPEPNLVDRFDGFLGGMKASYRRSADEANDRLEWPHFWKHPEHV